MHSSGWCCSWVLLYYKKEVLFGPSSFWPGGSSKNFVGCWYIQLNLLNRASTCILVAYRSRSLTPSSQCYLGFVNAPFVKKEKLMFASRQTRYLGLPFGQIWFYIDFTNFYISYHVNKHQPPPLPDNFLRWQSVWNQHGRVFSAVIDNLHLDFFLI